MQLESHSQCFLFSRLHFSTHKLQETDMPKAPSVSCHRPVGRTEEGDSAVFDICHLTLDIGDFVITDLRNNGISIPPAINISNKIPHTCGVNQGFLATTGWASTRSPT